MLLDTDILIDVLRGKKEARDFLISLPEESPHCCSTITVAEIHSGMRESERQKTADLIESLVVLPVTKEIAEIAGKFRRERKSRIMIARLKGNGKKTWEEFDLELDDCLIAATAVASGIELATRNLRHYPMPDVRVRPALY